jgi:membrane-bound serine protease (ClpP class)
VSFLGGAPAEWAYSLALLVLGFLLMLLELFVIPGFNIFGIVGFLTAVAGVGFAYVNMGSGAAAAVAGIGLVGTAVLVRLMLKMRGWQRLVLKSDTSRAAGYNSVKPGREALLGQAGEALTPLRPAGRALFGEQVVDVVSEGGFIDKGERIQVLKVVGNRVVVHRPEEGGEN